MNAYFNAMRNYSNFKGRASRSQYWLYTLIFFIILILCAFLDTIIGFADEGAFIVTGIAYLAHFIPSLAIAVRRLHDINRSGWWLLIAFIPLGFIVLIVFLCLATAAPTDQVTTPNP